MILPISTYPDDILRSQTPDFPIEQIGDAATQLLMDNMVETMYSAEGIGIAAPQVGQNIRICVIGKKSSKKLTDDLILVNPSWERKSKKKTVDQEGCLSIPRVYGDVSRWKDIEVVAYDRTGKKIIFAANSFFARVIQHEVDHLNGVLFIDTATNIEENE